MKVIIAGSRDFNDYNALCDFCDNALQNQSNVEIVSGTADGADKLGERYASEKQYSLKQFPADWDKHGKSAGYKRNVQMAEYADALIVFWNGESKGTRHMINIANLNNLPTKIYRYEKICNDNKS